MNVIRVKYPNDENEHVFQTGLTNDEFAAEFLGGREQMSKDGVVIVGEEVAEKPAEKPAVKKKTKVDAE